MTTIPEGIRNATLIQTSPSGHGYQPVRSLSESKSKSKSGSGSKSKSKSKRFPFSMAPRPPSTTQPSLPRSVSTATIRFRDPDPRGRIPPCLLSIPRPIATPTLLRHRPFAHPCPPCPPCPPCRGIFPIQAGRNSPKSISGDPGEIIKPFIFYWNRTTYTHASASWHRKCSTPCQR